ncbi:uncharacterized protein DUF2029 [Kitasatospora sp. SolWspMP-SS2h]|uniref:glycosyltransferase 87 family protein n=1 Tax=Kitasatospora sp. SolWspMP-SS2h TaxID=1305729 RepID=UPI000DC0323A|nr:glycosyltransferase 87 family protein [Kitasatospora sp. SolWspMP-SS2h]RAJ45406.1 uncharacterized protein DUF2029 [Kitasatospora sp. SolWspMP-SS2h]
MTARPALPCALAVTALAGCLALTFTTGGTLGDRTPLYGWYAADAALFATALLLLRRVPARQVTRLVLAGGVLVAATGLLAPPRTSDDAYRYGWDGKVQAAGVSPYAHTPEDPALTRLRDPGRFPVGDGCAEWDERRTADGACTRINRPAVHTVYPPLAEAWFLLQRPFGDGVRVAQAAGAALAVATTALLLTATGGRRRAALWAWCPGVAVWAVNDAHVDTLGALLTVAGLTWAARTRPVSAGAALGAATAVKLLPALALPGALSGVLSPRPSGAAPVADSGAPGPGVSGRPAGGALRLRLRSGLRQAVPSPARFPARLSAAPVPDSGAPAPATSGRPAGGALRPAAALALLVAAAGVFVLCYLPYVAASGAGVFGYLPGYLREEGYQQGHLDRFGLLRLVLPDRFAPWAGAALLAALVWRVLRHGDPGRPWRGALLVTGGALLLAAPGYPWYGLLVVALVALDGRWEWLAVPAAGQLLYLAGGGRTQQLAYGAALLVIAAVSARRAGRWPRPVRAQMTEV